MGEREITIKTTLPEAVVFDLGNTLLQDKISGALNGRIRSRLIGETFAPFVRNGFDLPLNLSRAIGAKYREGLEEFHIRKWLDAQIQAGFLDPNGSSQALEKLIRSTIISYSQPKDAERVLRQFMSLKIPMGVVSNSIFSGELLKSDIEELSVPQAFRFVISSADFGFRKPHPTIFREAVKKLKAKPSKTWYVGDLWENDVIGSSRAGLIPVWLNAEEKAPDSSIKLLRAKCWADLGKVLGF